MRLILLSLLLLLIGCNEAGKQNSTYITVIKDVTDPHLLLPDADEILTVMNLGEHKVDGAHFRYTEITDKVLVPGLDVSIPDATAGEKMNRNNEPMFREKAILTFMNNVRSMLKVQSQKDTITALDHSECFKIISKELQLLTERNSSHKLLWIYSNLQENSSILSVFNKGMARKLTTDDIEKIFEQEKLLPQNLEGITIVFSYLPKDRNDDFQFNQVVQAYKKLLEKRNALVIVQATNKAIQL